MSKKWKPDPFWWLFLVAALSMSLWYIVFSTLNGGWLLIP